MSKKKVTAATPAPMFSDPAIQATYETLLALLPDGTVPDSAKPKIIKAVSRADAYLLGQAAWVKQVDLNGGLMGPGPKDKEEMERYKYAQWLAQSVEAGHKIAARGSGRAGMEQESAGQTKIWNLRLHWYPDAVAKGLTPKEVKWVGFTVEGKIIDPSHYAVHEDLFAHPPDVDDFLGRSRHMPTAAVACVLRHPWPWLRAGFKCSDVELIQDGKVVGKLEIKREYLNQNRYHEPPPEKKDKKK